MQEQWETYMKPMAGQPASVAFNAGVADTLPDEVLGHVGFVKTALRRPTERGLVSPDEEDELGFVEDRLEMEALRYRIGKYVGRIVTNGEVHFIYYLKYDFEWPDAVHGAMRDLEGYLLEPGARPDAEWEVYRKLLFPTSREWQIIHNHHACDRLSAAGDDLRQKRAIEHRMYFESAEARERFAAQIGAEGFRVQRAMAPTEEMPLHGLLFYRMDAPHYYEIDALTLGLIEAGEGFCGQYDGWETSLVRQ